MALPEGVTLEILDERQRCRPSPTRAISYLDDGRQVVCNGPVGIVCDAERYDRSPRRAIVDGFGFPADNLGFARAWTRAEVIAKRNDLSVIDLLGRLDGFDDEVFDHVDHAERIVVAISVKDR